MEIWHIHLIVLRGKDTLIKTTRKSGQVNPSREQSFEADDNFTDKPVA